MKKACLIMAGMFPLFMWAQDVPETGTTVPKSFGFEDILIISTLFLVAITFFFIIYQLAVIRMQLRLMQKRRESKDPTAVLDEPSFLEGLTQRFIGLKPMEMEGDLIMEEHEYDGIVELNNGMPPWLQAFFGVTIVCAIGYIGYYYVLDLGPDQFEEYQMQVDKANKEKEERNKLYASSITEENVLISTSETDLSSGKKIFIDNCATCHRADAGGDSGPNLTDEYWLHGGGIKNIFKTVKNGYLEKGMPGWQEKLNPLQIQQVASYVISQQGTNPANPKAAQGELWKDEPVSNDSTTITSDSLKTDSIIADK